MSEDAAAVYERGANADRSAADAWERIQARNEETEWDIAAMLGPRFSRDSDERHAETP